MKRGGRLQRLFNNIWLVLPLFLLTSSLLIWSLWPLDAETRFQRGAALMASDNTDDWDRAWADYLEPLQTKNPDFRAEEVRTLQQKYEGYLADRIAKRAVLGARPMTEAQWFYFLGLRRLQLGDKEGARRIWEAASEVFEQLPSERPWVQKMREHLDTSAAAVIPEPSQTVTEVLKQVRVLRADGHGERANAVMKSLRELYDGDSDIKKILDK